MRTALTYVPRARAFSRRRGLSSITWGNARRLGAIMAVQPIDDPLMPLNPTPIFATNPGILSPIIMPPSPVQTDLPPGGIVATPIVGGTFPIPSTTTPVSATTLPAQVPVLQPVVVTPTSGTIPSPSTVAAATSTTTTSWLDQQLIPGINNSLLLLGGIAAFLFMGGKKN